MNFSIFENLTTVFPDAFTVIKMPKSPKSFYRYIGFDDEDSYFNEIQVLDRDLSDLGNYYLRLNEGIPVPYDPDLTQKIENILKNVEEKELTKARSLFEAENLFYMLKNTCNQKIWQSFGSLIELFIHQERISNPSIIKNFISKLILWLNQYIPTLFHPTTEGKNPKVVYYGSIKKHEVYFLILLSNIGCDVLYINSFTEDQYRKVDSAGIYSVLVEGKIKKRLPKNPFLEKPIKNIRLIESEDILFDVCLPVNKRSGYKSGPCPVVPVYFYRWIGVDTDIDEYYNRLYLLDKNLEKLNSGYLKFTNHIPKPTYEETMSVTSSLKQGAGTAAFSQEEQFIEQVLSSNVLPKVPNDPLNTLLTETVRDTFNLYQEKEPNANLSNLQNFGLKLLVWLNKYFDPLFSPDRGEENVPKVLFYGDIKFHELYFLILLSKLGCDVLFIHPEVEKDRKFKAIDPTGKFSKLVQMSGSERVDTFPLSGRAVRKKTVAYNASTEIQGIIYGSDVGLYRKWQLEESVTIPVTLKTTYDELKILWNEEAKIRPEFKVENNIVYIPNLFAKISGTLENLKEYEDEFRSFAGSPHTHIIKDVPFTEVRYTKQELYPLAFLLNPEGLFDCEQIIKNPVYRFHYLKSSLQNLIVTKINELILSNRFKQPVDDKFKLKILMTVLTMNEQILRLLEVFDYSSFVPKLVIFDNKKDVFSEEDAITLAFLNLTGIDIVIFTPTKYNNIEFRLQDNLFDIHQLPCVSFSTELPDIRDSREQNIGSKKSFFAKIFGR